MSTLKEAVDRVVAAKNAINTAISQKTGTQITGGLESAAAAIGTIPSPKPEQYKSETAGTVGKTVYPDTGKVLSYVNISPTPSTEKNVTASTSPVTVDPDSGKLLSRVNVYPTPSESKTVTSGTSVKIVSPAYGKLLSQVTVNPIPSEERTLTLTSTTGSIVPNSGKLMSKVTATVSDSNLIADNIKKDVTILGVTGTLESGGGGGGGGGDDYAAVVVESFVSEDYCQLVSVPGYIDLVPGVGLANGTSVLYKVPKGSSIFIDNGGYSSNCTFFLDGSRVYGGTYVINDHASLNFMACLASNTRITMADGRRRMIRDLVAGDMIMSINPVTMEDEVDEVVMADGTENKTGTIQDVWTFDDGTVVATINPHEFYNVTKGRMMYIADFEIGDRVLKYDRTTPALKEHRVEHGVFGHCTIFTKKNNLYFAAKILTGNRDSVPLSYTQAKA